MPRISVIVPVYNAEKYLRVCIESILNQTFEDFELILIDDGSSDASKDICYEYMKLDNRINLIEQLNQGVSVARNIGIKKSSGEYIMFCDADDWLEKDALKNLYDKINLNKDTDIVFSGTYKDTYLENKKVMNGIEGISEELFIDIKDVKYYLEYIYKSVLGVFQSPWAKLYSSKLIKSNNLYFNQYMICYEDFDFNLRYLCCCKNILFTTYISYHYRTIINNVGISKRKKNDLVYEISTVHSSMKQFLKNIEANINLINFIDSNFVDMYNLVLKKIIIEQNNMDISERNSILKHLFTDKEFLEFLELRKKSLRLYGIAKKLIDLRLYNCAYFIIKQRLS